MHHLIHYILGFQPERDGKIVSSGQAMDGLFRALGELFDDRSDKLNSVDVIYFCCGLDRHWVCVWLLHL